MIISTSNEFHLLELLPYAVLAAAILLFVLFLTSFVRNFQLQTKTAFFCMLISAGIAAASLFVILLQRQPTPLFAPGNGTGEEARYFSEADGALTIRVTEEEIYIGEIRCADAGELAERLKAIAPGKLTGVTVVDDYAAAKTFHETEEALGALGIAWQRERTP